MSISLASASGVASGIASGAVGGITITKHVFLSLVDLYLSDPEEFMIKTDNVFAAYSFMNLDPHKKYPQDIIDRRKRLMSRFMYACLC